MARPSIITDEFIEKFCSTLRVSGSIQTAILAAGIGRESYYGWARQVHNGRGTPMVKRFMKAVQYAEAEMKLMREHQLSKHFGKNWRLLARSLEKDYPEEYGRRRVCGDVESPRRHGTAARGRRGNMGGDTVITNELSERFCYVIKISGSITTAMMDAGIGWEIFDEWARQVRDGDATPAIKQFMSDAEKAEGEVKLRCERKLEKHFRKSWWSLAWWLDRKFPAEYARQAPPPPKQDAKGRFGGKGECAHELATQRDVALRVLTAEEIARGVLPGLAKASQKNIATSPWEAFRSLSSLCPRDQPQAVPGAALGPTEDANTVIAGSCELEETCDDADALRVLASEDSDRNKNP